MAGLIDRADIDEVRSRTRIDEIVGEYVTLKNAGIDSMKGLCPFHDERTPSFHVRPSVGMYHCFGCGESGDVFTFIQKMDGVTFVEAVQRLAERAGVQLSYSGAPSGDSGSVRQNILSMHQVATDFYLEQFASPAAKVAREYMATRGFDQRTLETFGVGYSPQSWDALLNHLRGRGFRPDDIEKGGLAIAGKRGHYDRFRGRLMWPIRDVTGRVIGFGARKLFDDDQGPKYLNTPETPVYQKNRVLYGLDLAKRSIAKTKRAVVVEGYTDVMAAHVSGVTQAVATCGTAFGSEHVSILRRMMNDDATAEVIFTFDGDEAGQKAALKAFSDDQKFLAQTSVVVEPGGMDPADLWKAKGEAAVRDLIEARRPLFEFVIDTTVARFDPSTVEGQVAAVRAAAPIIAGIKDAALRPGYERYVAGLVGVDTDQVVRAVRGFQRSRNGQNQQSHNGQPYNGQNQQPYNQQQYNQQQAGQYGGQQQAGQYGEQQQPRQQQFVPPAPSDPVASAAYRVERGALMVALQYPQYVNAKLFDVLNGKVFDDPRHRAIHEAMKAAGGVRTGAQDVARWPDLVKEAAPDELAPLVSELAVAPLPANSDQGIERYSRGIVARLFDKDMLRISGLLHSRLRRTDPEDTETTSALLQKLTVLEQQRTRLREYM